MYQTAKNAQKQRSIGGSSNWWIRHKFAFGYFLLFFSAENSMIAFQAEMEMLECEYSVASGDGWKAATDAKPEQIPEIGKGLIDEADGVKGEIEPTSRSYYAEK